MLRNLLLQAETTTKYINIITCLQIQYLIEVVKKLNAHFTGARVEEVTSLDVPRDAVLLVLGVRSELALVLALQLAVLVVDAVARNHSAATSHMYITYMYHQM